MTRYYYTDPLAAAWMAKHFGMQYATEHKEDRLYDWPTEIRMPLERYVIHPDSLHLLEPMVGDLFVGHNGLMRADETMYPKQGGGWESGVCYRIVDYRNRYLPEAWGDEKKIIQRNGIPFMWPEKETENE